MEIDWTQGMERTFEYYEVDPNTWMDKELLRTIKSCSIDRNNDSSTLGSASIDIDDMVGESYIRVYLIAIQNGLKNKVCLGTYLVQTPNFSFDGKTKAVSMDAYTPLLELNENQPPLGYALLKGENIMVNAYQIIRNYCRGPVVQTESDKVLENDFVANTSDTWLSYVIALINLAKYDLYLDEIGRILFEPQRKLKELSPRWTFNDDNSSILLPEISLKHDLYGIPNVVEVTADIGTAIYTARVENTDMNSPTSIRNRGREITYRETSPKFAAMPTKEMVDEYAESLLETLSEVEYEISYSHAYCPVRVGDCVRLNYIKADLNDVKAKIISQNIKCDTECTVTEKAVFTKNLWNK